MNLQEQNILFFTRTMKLGGTENVVLQLCEIFKPCVNKIVVCSCGGVNVEKLTAMGIKHIQINDIEEKSIPSILNTIKVLKKIVKEENITVEDKELEEYSKDMAKKYNVTEEVFLKEIGGIDFLKYDLEVRKALEIVTGK